MVRKYSRMLQSLVAAVWIAGASVTQAQTQMPNTPPEDKRPQIALRELLQRLQTTNPAIRSAAYQAEARKLEIAPRSALEDPKLSINFENYPVDSLSANRYGMTGNTIGISQTLPFPGKRSAIDAAASADHELAALEAAKISNDLLRAAALDYLKIKYNEKRLKLIGEESRLLKGMLAAADSRLSVGTETLQEVVEVRLENSALMRKKIEIEAETARLRAELDGYLEQPLPAGWRPEDSGPAKLDGQLSSEQQSILAAQTADPELQTLLIAEKGANKDAAVADFGDYPDFELMAGYTIRSSNNDDNGTDFVSAGVGMTVPIWRSDKQELLKQSARIKEQSARSRANARFATAAAEVRAAWTAIRSSEQKQNLIERDNLPQIEAAFSSARTAYETGQGELGPLFKLLRMKFEQRSDLIDASSERETAEIDLRYLTGGLNR